MEKFRRFHTDYVAEMIKITGRMDEEQIGGACSGYHGGQGRSYGAYRLV